MGLCASQARLLMLTARKSDLEFQTMQISQARMALAQNQETVAQKYTDAISNKKLQLRTSDGDVVNLTPQSLMSAGYGFRFNGKDYKSYAEAKADIDATFGASANKVGSDENVFQRYLMEGRITLLKPSEAEGEEDEYVELSVSGTNDIYEVYDTSDDAAAKAEYDAAMSKLQTKDKVLEMDADRIETEHNAIQTEIESVESVIKKNIETSYKTFAES